MQRPLESTQYTSVAFGKRCEIAGVRPSTGSVGDALDNAMAEAFFATLECELIDRRSWRNPAEARMAVFSFVEGWYNPRRRHSALDDLSPAAFEAKHRPVLEVPACTLQPATLYSAATQRKLLTPSV